jgi:hypothetical protein
VTDDRELPDLELPDLELPAPRSVAPAAAPPVAAPPIGSVGSDDDDELGLGIVHGSDLATFATSHASSPARGASSSSSGLEVTYRRPVGPEATASAAPSLLVRALARLVAWAMMGVAFALLARFAHRPGGRPLGMLLPRAFDGTSVVASGAAAGIGLVAALALGTIGLRLAPRAWSFVVAGGALLMASLAMVTVMLVAADPEPGPPDGALVVRWLVPVATLVFALGVTERGARRIVDEGGLGKTVGVAFAALGGAIMFAALETSALAASLGGSLLILPLLPLR